MFRNGVILLFLKKGVKMNCIGFFYPVPTFFLPLCCIGQKNEKVAFSIFFLFSVTVFVFKKFLLLFLA